MMIQLGNVRVARGYSAAFQVSHNSLSEICGEGETLAHAVGYLIRRLAHIELEWAQAEGGYRMKIIQDAIADLWRFDKLAMRRNSQAASTTQRPRCQTTKPSETERKARLLRRLTATGSGLEPESARIARSAASGSKNPDATHLPFSHHRCPCPRVSPVWRSPVVIHLVWSR